MYDNPRETLADVKARRKEQEAAQRFEEVPAFERFLKWRDQDDPRWDALDTSTRMQIAYYATDRAAARKVGQR